MKNYSHCYRCGGNITKESGLNLMAFLGFVMRVLCDRCYATKEKEILYQIFYWPRSPINSQAYVFYIVVWTFIAYPILMYVFITDALPSAESLFEQILVLVFIIVMTIHTLWQWYLRAQSKNIVRSFEKN